MNKTLILFKTMFKSEDVMELGTAKKVSKVRSIFKMIGLMLVLLLAGVSVAPFVIEIYDPLKMFGMEALVLKLLLFGASMMVLFFAFFYVMSVFYFASDIENYLYLPVKPGTIVLSKFMVVTFYEIVSNFALFFPSFVLFGYLDSQGAAYYVKVVLAMILLPIVPLSIMGILCMVLMRFSKVFRNKDRFTLVSTIFAIIAALTGSGLMQRLGTNPENGLPTLLQNSGPMFNLLSAVFPTVTLMNQAILGGLKEAAIYIPLTLLISGIAVFLFYQAGNLLYIDGAKGLKESGMKRTALSSRQFRDSTRSRSALFAIAMKEMKILLRTPAYFMNCVLVSLILPLFFVFPMVLGGEFSNILKELQTMNLAEIRSYVPQELVVVGIIAAMVFYAGLNMISATAITREGSNFSFMKYIPVPYRTQLLAKILPSFLVQFAGLAILLIPAVILLQPAPLSVALGLLLGTLLSLLMNLSMITVDVLKPVLTWTTEQRAVKQNFNAMVSSMLSIALGAVPVLLYFFVKIDLRILFGALFIVLVVLNALLLRALPGITERSFRNKP